MTSGRPVVFLHIGAMKTGTTFLQSLMMANKASLADAGYLFPGARWNEQDRAVRDILAMARNDPPMLAMCQGMWNKLAGQMLSHQGRASIFSMEFLSFASAKQARRVVGSLRGAEVHVILTVRDAVGAIPAQWQTQCRNGGTTSWTAFARGSRWAMRFGRLARGQGAREFEMTQGVPRMLGAWGGPVPPEHVHVVTVPRSGSDPMLLWERFASVVGMDPLVAPVSTEQSNPSLGQPSAELMRRINKRLGKLPPSEYQPTLKAQLATNILTTRSDREAGAALDRRTRAAAFDWNRRVREAIERSGVHLVGDLDDLPVTAPDDDTCSGSLSEPSNEAILAAADTAHAGLARLIHKRTRRLANLYKATDTETTGTSPSRTRKPWRDSRSPVDTAVTELAEMARVAIELHHQIRSVSGESR